MSQSVSLVTATFLFTDIEGSTQLWERHPQAMKQALARHDAILQQAIEAHHGRVVKTTGDGILAAFETAMDALAASLAAQQALHTEAWEDIQTLRVRMGLHTGEAEARADDYFGPALNRAARLMSVGHGGQVLVSASTVALVRDRLPPDVTLLDLGEHRLKDLIRPEHIFQVAHPALLPSFPPLRSLDSYPNNLPIQLTSFVGREQVLAEVRELLARTHLLTLTGPGGTGKTRLSLQLGAEVLPSFKDGVWLVELAPLDNPDRIVELVASTFDLRGAPGIPLQELITDYLRGKQLLLILDNCEHLIDGAARLANQLLRACPNLKILASSREGLGIPGEVAYRVPSLSLPDRETLALDNVAACEAVQLFVERATAAYTGFALTAENTPIVAQICRRLDGIPLALELAAARVTALSVEQIAARLDDRFRLLTGGSRTALPRQQTLRALIDWSCNLLSEPERALLRQLSVFVNGWTFEAAEAICPDLDVLDLLPQLVNKSLVVADDAHEHVRYRLLETIRQYARDMLFDTGEAAAARDRHLDYFLALSEEAEPELREGDHIWDWIDRVDEDYDNIQSALEWGQEGRPEDALSLAGNLSFVWSFRVDRLTAAHWLQSVIARLDALPPAEGAAARRRDSARMRGLWTLGALSVGVDFTQGKQAFDECLPIALAQSDKFMQATTHAMLASLAMFQSDSETIRAEAALSLSLWEEIDSKYGRMTILPLLAFAARMQGNMPERQRYHDEMRQLMPQADNPVLMPNMMTMGIDARVAGELDTARFYLEASLKLARRLKSKNFICILESELAHTTRYSGDFQAARAAYQRTILLWLDFGARGAVANQLECLAFVARAEGQFARAARLFGAAQALRELIEQQMIAYELEEYDREVAALREQMPADALASAWREGRTMSMERAVTYAVEDDSVEA